MSFKRNLIGFSVIYVFAATTVVAEGINGLFTWSLSDPETGDWFAPATNPCIASMASLGDKTLVLRTFLNTCDGFRVGMQVYQSTTVDFSLSCTTGNSVTDASISWTDDSSGTNYSHQLTEGSCSNAVWAMSEESVTLEPGDYLINLIGGGGFLVATVAPESLE